MMTIPSDRQLCRRRALQAAALAATLAGALAGLPGPAAADGEIIGIRSPSLSLYDGPEGKKTGALEAASVAMPLDVEEVAANRRLKVTIDGQTVWLAPHQVIMAEGVTVESGCISISAQFASTRALGSCE